MPSLPPGDLRIKWYRMPLLILLSSHKECRMSLPAVLTEKLRLPVVGAPLFIVSNPDLVISQCKSGIVGSFPALNARPEIELDRWLDRITNELGEYDVYNPDKPSAPFAVNQIVHKSNNRLEHDVEMCVKWRVPIVITSLGAREDVNEAIHSYGGIVLHDVINNKFAKKAIQKGADGIIAVAAGAGGHAGALSPFALVQEIREWFDGPLLLSGSIANGSAILASVAAGADLAYIGTPFIATAEANAVEAYKQAIVDGTSDDIVLSNLFTGVNGNYLKPSIVSAGLDPNDLPESDPSQMNFSSSGDSLSKAWKDIWGSGQGISAIKSVVSTKKLVERLSDEYRTAIRRINNDQM